MFLGLSRSGIEGATDPFRKLGVALVLWVGDRFEKIGIPAREDIDPSRPCWTQPGRLDPAGEGQPFRGLVLPRDDAAPHGPAASRAAAAAPPTG